MRLDRPRDRGSVDETVADLAALARAVLRRLPDTDGMIGIGVGVVGIVRRDAGVVTMAPNLGWRDVPLAERLADALGTSLPIAVANEADLGALAELRRGAADRRAARALPLRRGRRRRRPDHRRPAAHRRARVRRRGRAHAGQPRRAHVPLRLGRLLGDRGRRGRAAAPRRPSPGRRPRGGRGRPQRGRRRLARRARGARRRRRAGWASGWPASSTSSTRRWWSSAGSSAASIPSWRRGCRASSTGSRSRRRARRSGSLPAALGDDAPLIGAAELAFEPLLADPSLWTRPAVATA